MSQKHKLFNCFTVLRNTGDQKTKQVQDPIMSLPCCVTLGTVIANFMCQFDWDTKRPDV